MECVIVKKKKDFRVFYSEGNQIKQLKNNKLKITSKQDGMQLIAFKDGKFLHNDDSTPLQESIVHEGDIIEFLDDCVYIISKTDSSVHKFNGNIKKPSNLQIEAYRQQNILVIEVPIQIHAQYVGIRHKGKLVKTLNVRHHNEYHVMFNVHDDKDIIVFERDRRAVFFLRNALVAFLLLAIAILFNTLVIKSNMYVNFMLFLTYVGLATLIIVQPPITPDVVWFPLTIVLFAVIILLQLVSVALYRRKR